MIGGISTRGVDAEFKFWSKLGVDFMQLGVAYDFFFEDGKVKRVIELKGGMGLTY